MLKQLRREIDASLRLYETASAVAERERRRLRIAERRCKAADKAQALTQQLAQTIQEHAHTNIAGIVTRCLQTIFPNPYQFKILFERKRGKTEARFVFVRDGQEVADDSVGDSVIDVAAFALRLACLVLIKPPRRRILIMDEPFRTLDNDNIQRVDQLLQTLAEELQMQFILTTNNDSLRLGKIIDLQTEAE